MPTNATTDTESAGTSKTELTVELRTASAPVPTIGAEVKAQVSAPSYLRSLADNELPPFRRPPKEPRPCLLVGGADPLISESDVVDMIAAAQADRECGLQKYLACMLVQKKIILNYELSERNFIISLLVETVDYAAQRDFSAHKLASLFIVYIATHAYFKWYYWTPPRAIWAYFKELMIRHTIEDSPDGQEVFTPEECYDIMTHFHTIYINNLPLVHIATFGTYRLRLGWPFKLK